LPREPFEKRWGWRMDVVQGADEPMKRIGIRSSEGRSWEVDAQYRPSGLLSKGVGFKRLLCTLGRWIVAFAISSAAVATAHAMQFTLHDPCGGGNASYCAPRILGAGEIMRNDAQKLRGLVQQWLKEGAGGFSGITLHSPGGSLAGGIFLGREIRRLNLDTIGSRSFTDWVRGRGDPQEKLLVPRVECHSACVYAFAGGMDRSVEDGAVFGVHQFASSVPNPSGESDAQVTAAVLRGYLQEMGVMPELLDIASLVPASGIRLLTIAEMRRVRRDNTTKVSSGWKVAAAAGGQALVTTTKELDYNRTLHVAFWRTGDGLMVHVLIELDKQMRADRLALFPAGSRPELVVTAARRSFKASPVLSWRRAGSAQDLAYEAAGLLSAAAADALVSAGSVKLEDGLFGKAWSDIGPWEVELGVEGLADSMLLLRRQR
jgi:hypothetical protein